MPAGKHKSRTFRRVHKVTPGHRNTIHYVPRKPKSMRCGGCGAVLKGMPRERPGKLRKLSKSSKSPSRPYGGNLCSSCMRNTIVAQVRSPRQ